MDCTGSPYWILHRKLKYFISCLKRRERNLLNSIFSGVKFSSATLYFTYSWTKSATPHVTAYKVRWKGPEADIGKPEEQTVLVNDDAKG